MRNVDRQTVQEWAATAAHAADDKQGKRHPRARGRRRARHHRLLRDHECRQQPPGPHDRRGGGAQGAPERRPVARAGGGPRRAAVGAARLRRLRRARVPRRDPPVLRDRAAVPRRAGHRLALKCRRRMRAAAGTVVGPFGAVAQLVERFHGMEEVRGSIPLSSTQERPVPSERMKEMTMLDPDDVDLDELAQALDDHSADASYGHSWWLDPVTGAVTFHNADIDEGTTEDLDDAGLINIGPMPSSIGYQDMEDFIERVADRHARDLLARAIAGRGRVPSLQGHTVRLPTASR